MPVLHIQGGLSKTSRSADQDQGIFTIVVELLYQPGTCYQGIRQAWRVQLGLEKGLTLSRHAGLYEYILL